MKSGDRAKAVAKLLRSVRLVSAVGLATVEVGIDTRIDLVQRIGLVRTGSVGSRSGGDGASKAASGAGSMRRVTSSVCASRVTGSVRVSKTTSAAGGVGGAESLARSAAVVTVRVDARIGGVGNTRAVLTIGTLGCTSVGAQTAVASTRAQSAAVTGGARAVTSGTSEACRASGVSVATNICRALGVGSEVLAVVTVGVDARISLVGEVGAVRAIGRGGRAVIATVVTYTTGGTGANGASMGGV
jgi:hypothetical protein